MPIASTGPRRNALADGVRWKGLRTMSGVRECRPIVSFAAERPQQDAHQYPPYTRQVMPADPRGRMQNVVYWAVLAYLKANGPLPPGTALESATAAQIPLDR
jgi:hypothetical protein